MKKLSSIIGMTFNGILVKTELVFLLIGGDDDANFLKKQLSESKAVSEIITHMSMDLASDSFPGITVYLKFGIIS